MKKKLSPLHAQFSSKSKLPIETHTFQITFTFTPYYISSRSIFPFFIREIGPKVKKSKPTEREREGELSVPVSEKRTERREKRHITSVIVARAWSGRPRPAARGAATLRGVRTPAASPRLVARQRA